MGEEAPKRHSRRPAGSGLEFVGAPKRSRFAQYTDRFSQYSGRVSDVQKTAVDPSARNAAPAAPAVHNREQAAAGDHSGSYDAYMEIQGGYPAPQQPAYAASAASGHEATSVRIPAGPAIAQPFIAQPVAVDETAFAEPIAAELEAMTPVENEEEEDIPTVTIQHPSKASDKEQRLSRLKRILSYLVALLCLGIITVSGWYLYSHQPLISGHIKKQAGFPLYSLINNPTFTADRKSVKTGDNSSIVYDVYSKGNKSHFIVSQQKVPSIIKEDAQYQQFLAQIDKFADFNSSIGKAYLTKPPNTGDDVTVVVKGDTTLLFIRGPGTTTDDEWAKLLSSLKLSK